MSNMEYDRILYQAQTQGREVLMKLIEYLQSLINNKMSLAEMVDAFEKMCLIPINSQEELKLFEVGTYSFTGQPLCHLSLVRQFPNHIDEYYQVHLDVLYLPSELNQDFMVCVWEDCIDQEFFSYIREHEVYRSLSNEKIFKYNIYIDET